MMDELAEAARRTADGLALDDIRDLLEHLLTEIDGLRNEIRGLRREVDKERRPITEPALGRSIRGVGTNGIRPPTPSGKICSCIR